MYLFNILTDAHYSIIEGCFDKSNLNISITHVTNPNGYCFTDILKDSMINKQTVQSQISLSGCAG